MLQIPDRIAVGSTSDIIVRVLFKEIVNYGGCTESVKCE
jgi:hypothetical protein